MSIIGFALSKSFAAAMVFLMVSGMADGISVIIRLSIYQALTPEHLRGRVSAINGIFISGSSEIGAFESGLVAKLIGTVPCVLLGGVMTLTTVGIMSWIFPGLQKVSPHEPVKLKPVEETDERPQV